MTGPKVKRLPSTEPSLHQPALDILSSVFGKGGGGTLQQNLTNKFGFTMPPELQNAFANYLAQPTGQQRTDAATLSMQGALGGAGSIPGFDVLAAAGPIFQRNLSNALAAQTETGPRFASTAANQSRLLQQQGLQDFNLFAQQVLEQGRQRQLQGILGFAQANQGQQQLQAQFLQQLLGTLFGTGLSQGVTVGPSTLGQITGGIGAIAGGAAGLGFQPFK